MTKVTLADGSPGTPETPDTRGTPDSAKKPNLDTRTTKGEVAESRVAKFAWSAALAWAYQGLVLVIGLWLTRFLLARLGEGLLGWWAQAVVLVGYLQMVDFGVNSLLPREVAAASGRAGGWRNATDIPDVFARYAKFALWQTPLAVAIAILCGLFLARGSENGEAPFAAIVGLMAVSTAAFPLRVGQGMLWGLQDVRFAGFAQMLTYLLSVGTMIVAVEAGWGAMGLMIGWAVQPVLMTAALWARLLRRYPSLLPGWAGLASARVSKGMLIDGAWSWTASTGAQLAGTADVVAIAWFFPPDVVFQYVCTVKLIMVFNPLVMTLCQSVLPGLAELKATSDGPRIQRASSAYTELILGASGAIGCVVLAADAGFVAWWVGPTRYLGDLLVWSAVIAMNLRHWINAMAVTLFCLKRERPLWALTMVDGLLTFAATAALVRWGGPTWAPLGSVIGAFLFLPVALALIVAEGTLPIVPILRTVAIWGLLYAVLGTASALAGQGIQPRTPLALVVVAWSVGSIYLLAMAGPALHSNLATFVRHRLGLSNRSMP